MTTAIESLAALHVGTVDAVAPDSITVRLDSEAPQTIALNAGVPSPFPRLNGYVLIPKESGALVGLVVWIGIERWGSTKTTKPSGGVGLVDLPFPQRRMVVTPVGTLFSGRDDIDDYQMERGVAIFPSVGDDVLLPSRGQLRAVIEPTGNDRRVHIGQAILAAGAHVAVDPDKLFGRHVAVLGNTGSGKSCTVAGLVRWSLEAAVEARRKKGKSLTPNARFIVLDPNGEYTHAFDGLPGGVRCFRVPPVEAPATGLTVPAWMWNGHEWSAFAAAAPRVQRPMLIRALRDVRVASGEVDDTARGLAHAVHFVRTRRDWLCVQRARGTQVQGAPERRAFGNNLSCLGSDLETKASLLGEAGPESAALKQAATIITQTAERRASSGGWYDPFSDTDLLELITALDDVLDALPQPREDGIENEDSPAPFDPAELLDRLDVIAQDDQTGAASAFIATLVLRIRTMLADRRMSPIVNPRPDPSFENWLTDVIGADNASNGAVAVIDLSLVPSEIVHTVVAVLGRIVFEATQRHRRRTSDELPTTIVLEEAHTFVRKYESESSDIPTPAQMCLHTFERIAREGRKFGLGLVLSSQRPSELSATVLAQCNTFILHRLVNDRDQDLVARLVPDNLSGLLKELPTLPTRHAIMLGWATPLPVLMQVRELPESHRPRSADPAFWETWTGEVQRPIDWGASSADWTNGASSSGASNAQTEDQR